MRKLLSVLALGVVVSLGFPSTGSFALADLPAWTPKADLAQKLAPETALPRFTLQLPQAISSSKRSRNRRLPTNFASPRCATAAPTRQPRGY